MTAGYMFIAEEKATPSCVWTVAETCRGVGSSLRLAITTGGVGAHRNVILTTGNLGSEIETVWDENASGRTCGVPRMCWWLHQQGFNPSAKRVARIMLLAA